MHHLSSYVSTLIATTGKSLTMPTPPPRSTSLPSASASSRTHVARSDILPMPKYESVRKEMIAKYRTPLKKLKRVHIGPRSSLQPTCEPQAWSARSQLSASAL